MGCQKEERRLVALKWDGKTAFVPGPENSSEL